jgi:hypothetical protein
MFYLPLKEPSHQIDLPDSDAFVQSALISTYDAGPYTNLYATFNI